MPCTKSIDGKVVEKPMGSYGSSREFASILPAITSRSPHSSQHRQARADRSYETLSHWISTGAGFRRPDIAFVSFEPMAEERPHTGAPDNGPGRVIPDLADRDRQQDGRAPGPSSPRRSASISDAGARAVWLIYLEPRKSSTSIESFDPIRVLTQGRSPRRRRDLSRASASHWPTLFEEAEGGSRRRIRSPRRRGLTNQGRRRRPRARRRCTRRRRSAGGGCSRIRGSPA